VVKAANRLQRKQEAAPKEGEVDLLRQICDELRMRTPVRP